MLCSVVVFLRKIVLFLCKLTPKSTLFPTMIRLVALLLLLTACGPTVNQTLPLASVTVPTSFQKQAPAISTPPTYICGAWSSENVPDMYSSIMIYAKLTKDLAGVGGATAKAVVHFRSGDVTLDQRPVSDTGGYVTFNLALAGRQPHLMPATVDVSFVVNGTTIRCSHAFFTPR